MYPARRRGFFHQQIITAIQLQFQHRHSEYWYFALFNIIFAVAAMLLNNFAGASLFLQYRGLGGRCYVWLHLPALWFNNNTCPCSNGQASSGCR